VLPPTDRRAERRIDVNIDARVLTATGGEVSATVCNISRTGLLISVASESVSALLPNIEREMRHLPVGVSVEFTADQMCILVECGIVHLRRAAANTCRIGLEFRNFRDDGAAHLAAFYLRLSAAFAHTATDP
jgi:hypothetical protein